MDLLHLFSTYGGWYSLLVVAVGTALLWFEKHEPEVAIRLLCRRQHLRLVPAERFIRKEG